jgi:CelD/BcsL family acetyltransferase involved in cellulose biosynthesis
VDEQIGNAAIIEDTWRAVMRSCGAHVCDLPYVSEGSRLYDIADKQPRAIVSERADAAIAKLRGETDWQAFCETLGTLSGRKPGARERRLSKEGKLVVRMLSPQDTGDYATWVDWLLARKREWIDRAGKRGDWLHSLAYRDFLVDMLDPPAGDAMARLFVVTLDGVPLAASVVGIGESCITGLIAAFDQRYSKYSPISIVIEHCVKWALEQGKDLDFGVGSESFKAYWSRDNITRTCSFRIAINRWGLLAIHTQETVRRLKTRAPQWQWSLRQIKPQAGPRLEPLVQSSSAFLSRLGGLTKFHPKQWHHHTPLHDHHRVER